MKQLDVDAPFPVSDDVETLYVKLSWDSKSFKVLDSAPPCLNPSLPLSPPRSPLAAIPAARGRSRRALPTPDPAMLLGASQGEARRSRTPRGSAAEAASLRSETKLSASKSLNAKRRGVAARTPGVRKKLQLCSESPRRTASPNRM